MRLELLYLTASLLGYTPNTYVCSSSGEITAFVNVHVVPMDTEQVLAHQTVLIQEGRIIALGPANQVPVPAGAIRIDGQGKYLIPGLGEMHVHLGPDLERQLFSYLAHGVTTIRHLGGTGRKTGPELLRLKAAPRSPRLYLGARLGKGQGPVLRELASIPPDSVALLIAAYKAQGHDFIETSADYAPDERAAFDSVMAAADRLGLPVASHDHAASFAETLAFGAHGGSVEHLYAFQDTLQQRPEISAMELEAFAMTVKRSGVWISPTMGCQKYITSSHQALKQRLVKKLQEAGVDLLLGSDAGGGVGRTAGIVHLELSLLVQAGLTPYAALRTATYNVAKYFGMLDKGGTVAVGKRADLVLLHANPLDDIQHTRAIVGVMVDGQWLDRATLDQGLLASPTFWLQKEIEGGILPWVTSRTSDKVAYYQAFEALADSLATMSKAGAEASERYRRLVQRQADEFGALRTLLTPEQRVAYDSEVRVWLREQIRQGYEVTVPGMPLSP